MAENPFQSLISPNAHQANLYDMRLMSMANRMETPFERGMGRSGARGGLSGNPMLGSMMGAANEPDYSQFTYDPVMRQRAIAAGVSPLEANQVQQNVLLPNTGFFGRHPNLSRALEGGIFAAASTPSSGGIASTGENVSNALEGMIAGNRIHQGLWRQQFARPFEGAGALEQLNDMGEQRQLRQAQIKRYKDESDIQNERIAMQRQNELDKINATRPVPVEGGVYEYQAAGHQPLSATFNNALTGNFSNPPTESGWRFLPGAGRGKGQAGDITEATREGLRAQGIDPEQATPEQLHAAEAGVDKRKKAEKNSSDAPKSWAIDTQTGSYVPLEAGMSAKRFKPMGAAETGARTAADNREKWVAKTQEDLAASRKTLGSQWKSEYTKDSAARAKALGEFYDHMSQSGLAPNADGSFTYTPPN
jgi:hypothetical protein